jgi:Bacterial Ig-like domain (group 3)/FG-GAP-like repeat
MPSIACSVILRLSFFARLWEFLLSLLAHLLSFVAKTQRTVADATGGLCRCNDCMRSCVFVLLSTLLLVGPASGASTTATTTSLTVTSGGSVATTVVSGSVVTLTATVMASSTAVTVGQVNFCDATAKYCTGTHLLGTAQLTKQGSATLKFRLGPTGSHSYNAVFAGTTNYATSTSGTEALAVAPRIMIQQSGSSGNYTLTTAIEWAGNIAPTGAVSFLDSSDNNAVLGTSALSSSATSVTFGSSSTLTAPMGDYYSPILVGDFNGDGIQDLILGRQNELLLFLGNDDGTFTASGQGWYSPSGPTVVAGDFNGDGILDLLINEGTVLLGNGDGTFTTGESLALGTPPYVVGDFNGDGTLDLVSNDGHVLLGNGDGTFTAGASLPVVAGPYVVGDFNGDGVLDLVLSNGLVLLGKGDGTFVEGAYLPTGTEPYVAGDFNGDGVLDLVSNDGIVLLGKGDGTFTAGESLPASGPFVVGDFNGDSILDLATFLTTPDADGTSYTVTMLLGNGDGTFTVTPRSDPSGYDPAFLATGDFNGDGVSDLIVSEGYFHGEGSDAKVSLSGVPASTAAISNITVLPAGSGTHQVVASYAGDGNYKAVTSSATSLTAVQGTPTVSVISSPNPEPYGTPVTLTSTVTGGGLTPTGGVTFYDGSAELGAGTLNSSGVVTYTTNAFSIGSHSITAKYAGDSNYTAGTSTALILTVNMSAPAAILTASPSPVLYGTQVAFTATLTGGGTEPTGTVTFFDGTTALGTGTLSKGIAAYATSVLSIGSHSITASYGGDGNYTSVTSAASVVQVSQVLIAVPAPSPVAAGVVTTTTATLSAGSTYSGTMNLTCILTGSPTGAQSLPTCSLNPASVTVTSGGNGTAVMTVNTTAAATTAFARPFQWNRWKFGSEAAAIATVLMLGIPSRRRRWLPMLVLLSVVVFAGVTGCSGGGGSSTPPPGSNSHATTPGSYTFTVAGTDTVNSKITTSASVSVTVQ